MYQPHSPTSVSFLLKLTKPFSPLSLEEEASQPKRYFMVDLLSAIINHLT